MTEKILIALIGIFGVLIGAFITVAKEWWMTRQARHENAEYLAIRIVSMLDRFIEGCTRVSSDDGLYRGQRDKDGCRHEQVSLPVFDPEPLEVDWKSVPATLMYEILSFPNLINSAGHSIESVMENDNFPDYADTFEERQYQYAILGLKASKMVDELRTIYGITARIYDGWNPIEHLTECKDRITDIRIERHVRMGINYPGVTD